MVVVAPERSLDQRLAALDRANEIRMARAQLKRDVKAGRRSVRDVLLDPPDWAATMHVLDLLLAAPKVGRVKANKVLQLSRVSPSKTLGGMTTRQRVGVAAMLRR